MSYTDTLLLNKTKHSETDASIEDILDDIYNIKNEISTQISNINSVISAHKNGADHDGRYYTKTQMDTKFNSIPNASTSANGYQTIENYTQVIENTKNRHTHNNKLLLDEITENHINKYASSSSKGGPATSTVKLQTARTVNGTSFDGTSNITTANWGAARILKVGNTAKSVNGSANITWNLDEIGTLPTAGGNMTGPINSNLESARHLDANKGKALINSTSSSGSYTMLAKLNSTNGVFTLGTYTNSLRAHYTTNTVINSESNSVTKTLILLDEAGNSNFPGTVTSPSFIGNASTATALTSSGGSHIQPVYFSGGKPISCTYTLAKSVPANAAFTDTLQLYVGSATPATSSSYLLWIDTGNNNIMKFRTSVSSGTWLNVSSVWNTVV